MKILIIISSILVVLFIASQVWSYISNNNIESYRYKVVKKVGDVEIRLYEKALFARIEMDAMDYDSGSSKGFRILANYIFGGNSEDKKISMTSPVVMDLNSSKKGDSKVESMMFMIPKKYNKNELPKPKNGEIKIVEVSEKKMAAISFGGFANDAKIKEHKQMLTEVLSANNIAHKDNFSFLGYNSPFQLVFRKNEVIVELE